MAAESLALSIVPNNTLVAAELADAREQLGNILSSGTPENTRLAYEADWAYFQAWHAVRFLSEVELPLSVDTVLIFITDHLQGLPERVENALVSAGRKRAGVCGKSQACRAALRPSAPPTRPSASTTQLPRSKSRRR